MSARHGNHGFQGYPRMFPNLPPARFKRDALIELAAAQLDAATQLPRNSDIPAGYTYFGQLVDHDITHIVDRRSGGAQQSSSPSATIPSPALDLDCLYGEGLGDERLVLDPDTGKFDSEATLRGLIYDLPRGRDGDRCLARVPDDRNDDNFIIAQLHVLLMNLHNRVIDGYSG